MLSPSSPITSLGSIAVKISPTLKKMEINTVGDLLYHFPSRHVDLTNITPIRKLVPGILSTIQGTTVSIEDVRSKWKRIFMTHAIIQDATGAISCLWFHQRFLTKVIKKGDILLLTGKVDLSKEGLELVHPEYEKVLPGKEMIHGGRIVPLYPLTQKLTHKTLRFLMKMALQKTTISEWLPSTIRSCFNLTGIKTALTNIHFPTNEHSRIQAENRLKFDELFLLHVRNTLARKELTNFQAPLLSFHEQETKNYVTSLPFQLTYSQKQTAWEIVKDLEKTKPMNRLLDGDVGSGKTVVASIAMLNSILSGFQVAYMAPTEILAEQQFQAFCRLFEKRDMTIGLITSSGSFRKQSTVNSQQIPRKQFIREIRNGSISLVIGTHSLIQKDVVFNNLGLVVVDEQHRFGVNQRASLARRSTQMETQTNRDPDSESLLRPSASHPRESAKVLPHFLSMTATPIPRTLALTVYGDLDISVIREMPRDRKPITTQRIPHEKRTQMYQHIQTEIQKGRQAFVVCPLIDPSDALGVKSATEEVKKIKTIFPHLSVAMLHGRLSAKEKNTVMKQFLEQKYHILVTTPVVEVGIDVPNATIMVIENAERFGLAQLHQLRGRVGRSEHQSTCYLLSESESEDTKRRLQAVINSQNGMELAEKDLEIRGPGDLWGVKQAGFEETLYIAKLTDYPIIQQAKEAAEKLLGEDPTLARSYSVKKKVEEVERKIHPE